MTARVFISYARGDDGEPYDPATSFVTRLHADLTQAGFDVWFDRVSMPSRQLTFHQEIADAIRGHDRLILVVGPKAAVSDYVRQEWRWALELDKPVIAILRQGDYEHIPGELALAHCDDFRDDAHYPAQLAKLIENLRRPPPPLGALFGVPSLPLHFLGRPELLRRVKDALLVDLQKPVVITGEAARVGMQGMGGIGKSVLAAALARDCDVRRSYPDGIVWVAVGQQPDRVGLQSDVARRLGYQKVFETETQGLGVLRQLLAQKAVLLVLDDVWHASDAQAFDALGPRCRALITTRDAGILHTLHGQSIPVSLFTQTEALQLLADAVGVQRVDLPPEAREVVTECGCLPLAVALCGGMARKNAGEWAAILQRLRRADLEKIADREAINEQHQSIWRAMKVSVDALSSEQRRRFAELAVFAPGGLVPQTAVRTLWAHTGNLDDLDTADLLVELGDRSLIQLDQKVGEGGRGVEHRFRLHDLLYDYATRIAGDSVSLHEQLLDAYRKLCPNGWPSGPNDGYFLEHLLGHMLGAGRHEDAVELLEDLFWLEAKTHAGLVFDLVNDFTEIVAALPEAEPQRRILHLLEEALRRNILFITQHCHDYPQALFQCMWNACWWRDCTDTANWYERRLGEAKEHHEFIAHAVQAIGLCMAWVGRRFSRPDSFGRTQSDLQRLLERWRRERRARHGGFSWLRSLLPPPCDLGCGLERVFHGREAIVAFSPEGLRLVIVSRELQADGLRDSLIVWRLDTLESPMLTLEMGQTHVDSVAFLSDGRRIVVGSTDGTVRMWDLDRPEVTLIVVASIPIHEHLRSMTFSTDGRLVVGVSNGCKVEVWQLGLDGAKPLASAEYPKKIAAAAVSANGSQLVVGLLDGTVWVDRLDRPDLEPLVLGACCGDVTCVAFSPDGCRVGATSKDGTICVWRLDPVGSDPTVWRAHEDWTTCMAFSPDGQRVASASYDSSVRVWSLNQLEGVEEPCEDIGIYSTFRVSAWPDGRRGLSSVVQLLVTVSNGPGGPLPRMRPLCRGFHPTFDVGTSVLSSPAPILSEYVELFDFVRPRDRIWLGRHGFEVFILKLEEDGV